MLTSLKYLILFLLISLSAFAHEWKVVYEVPFREGSSIYELKCADSLNCIAFYTIYEGWANHFVRTSNGGKTWENIYGDTSETLNPDKFIPFINDIEYLDTNLFLAVGDSGLVLRTTDQGKTWSAIITDNKRMNYLVRMINNTYGIIYSAQYKGSNIGGKFYVTYDGGKNWNLMNTPNELWDRINDSFYVINDSLFVILASKTDSLPPEIIWVKGNWESWERYNRSGYANKGYFIDENTGWLIGARKRFQNNYSQLIEFTSDGGKTWEIQRDTLFNSYGLKSIDFFDSKNGMTTGGWANVIITKNGGKTWYEDTIKTISDFDAFIVTEIQYPSITTAYCIGNFGYIIKYERDWNNPADNEELDSEGYNVSLYPNPAADKLNLSLTKDMYGETEVNLIDIHGRTISSFKTREFTSSIDVSGLPPGVYGVLVRFGNKVISKRVSVIR